MYISLYGKLFILTKSRNGRTFPSEVKLPHDDSYKYMTVQQVMESWQETGISYICNGDFHSMRITHLGD